MSGDSFGSSQQIHVDCVCVCVCVCVGLVTCSSCHLDFVKEFPRFGRKISAKIG